MLNKTISILNKKIPMSSKKASMIFLCAFFLCVFALSTVLFYSHIKKQQDRQTALSQKEMPIIQPLIMDFLNAPYEALISGSSGEELYQKLLKYTKTQWVIERHTPRYLTTEANPTTESARSYTDFKPEFTFIPEKSTFSPAGDKAKIWVKTLYWLYTKDSTGRISTSGLGAEHFFVLFKEADGEWEILADHDMDDDSYPFYLMSQGFCSSEKECIKYLQLLSKKNSW